MKIIYGCLTGIMLLSTVFGQSLDLSTLSGLILDKNNSLKSSEKEIDIKASALEQSKMFDNPTVEFEKAFGVESEISSTMNQSIPLGRKRKHNIRLHELKWDLAKLDYLDLKSQILTEAFTIFVEILQLQECLLLLETQMDISKELVTAVEKKVMAGKLSTAELSRVKIQYYQEKSYLREIENSIQDKWSKLTTYWGETQQPFTQVSGEISTLFDFPTNISFKNSYEYQRAAIQVEIENSHVDLEKSNRIPDVELLAGMKKIDSSEKTFQLGLSIPLPIFNRNTEHINEVKLQREKLNLYLSDVSIKIKTEISNIQRKLKKLETEIIVLRDEIIPEANSAYLVIYDGYLNGRYTYLDIVDAKKMWNQTKTQLLNTLTEHQIEIMKLNHISGNINKNMLGEN